MCRSYTYSYLIGVAALAILLFSCNNTKHLAEDEELYIGAELTIKSDYDIPNKGQLKSDIDEVLRPDPNSSFLGMRFGLWFYNMIGDIDKDKGIKYFIKYKMGEAPVLYQDVNPQFVSNLIKNRLQNNGYFDARVDFEVVREKEQKVQLHYNAEVQRAYRYDSIFYNLDTSPIGQTILDIEKDALIKPGDQYSLSKLRQERDRIDRNLKNNGFYYFNPEYIHVQADTSGPFSGDYPRQIDLFIGLDANIPAEAKRQYFINQVYIYPNYQLSDPDTSLTNDTILINGYTYVNNDSDNEFRPGALVKKINLRKGKQYEREDHEYTINRTMGMGAFKFVDVRFQEVDTSGKGLLDAYVYMTPMPKKKISSRISLVSKSNNYAGPGLELEWKNRNTFGGAELLKFNVNGGFETQFGGEEAFNNFSSYQFGASARLSFPRFIIPFKTTPSKRFIPETTFGLSYELVNRLRFFRLSSISLTSGYYWRETAKKQHELNPMVIRYLSLSNVSDEFQKLLDANPFLDRSFAEQYIIGPQYTYTFSNQVDEDLRNHFYLTASADFSNPFSVFGKQFSTYYRFSTDIRYYYKVSGSSRLVGRLAAGIGVPYGNSEGLPYVKQFFTGGPNSIRAFRARTVGPGTVQPREFEEGFGFQDQNGNMKFEANLEYRFDIYGIFKGALFADAGNIWLLEEDPNQPGGKFESKDFLDELAVGAGFGLRIDISYFVLRLDMAWPIRKPYLPAGERWIHPLRDEHPILNIAIGYPF